MPRILGLDVARGLALVGMLAAHTVPEAPTGEYVWDGRSSILFATVAGVSLGLISARPPGGPEHGPEPARSRAGRVVRVVAIRAVLLILLGVFLTFLETPIAIILDTYGFLFVVAIPLLFAPRWVLAVVAVAAALAGPWLVQQLAAVIGTATTGATPDTTLVAIVTSPAAYFPEAWLTGVYPAPVWLAYIAVGILIARSDITRRSTQLTLLVVGAAVALTAYTLATALGQPVEAHDDSGWEVLASGAVAVAVIGGCTALTGSTAPVVRTWSRRLLQPLWAAGSMPLTVYTVQIIAIWAYTNTVDYDGWLAWQSVPLFFAFAVPTLVLCSLYRLRFTQGPLEWFVSRVSTQRPWRRGGERSGEAGASGPEAAPDAPRAGVR